MSEPTPLSLTFSTGIIISPDTSCNMTIVFDGARSSLNSGMFTVGPPSCGTVDLSTFTSSNGDTTWTGKFIKSANINIFNCSVLVRSNNITIPGRIDLISDPTVYLGRTQVVDKMSLSSTGEPTLHSYRVAMNMDGTIFAYARPIDNSVSVYQYNATTNATTLRGSAITNSSYNYMGSSIALSSSGNRIAIAMNTYNTNVLDDALIPRVLVYDFDGTSWSPIGGIDDMIGSSSPSVGNSRIYDVDSFGYSISLSPSGTRLAVGIPQLNNASATCAVNIYDYDSTNWNLTQTLSDASGTQFGICVALQMSGDGEQLVVGAPMTRTPTDVTGRGYVYSNNSGWTKIAEINGAADGDRFGTTAAISNSGSFGDVAFGGYPTGSGTTQSTLYRYNSSTSTYDTVRGQLNASCRQISLAFGLTDIVCAMSIPINRGSGYINERQIVVKGISTFPGSAVTDYLTYNNGTTSNLFLGEYLQLCHNSARMIIGSTTGVEVYRLNRSILRKIYTMTASPTTIAPNATSTLTLPFSSNAGPPVFLMANYFTFTPSNLATLTNLATSNSAFTYTATITANDGVSNTDGIILRYAEPGTDVSGQITFNINDGNNSGGGNSTIDISSVIIDPSSIDYTSTATLSIQFSETATLDASQIIFTPSDVSMSELSFDSGTNTYVTTLTFPTATSDVSTNYTADIVYNSDVSRNISFDTNTYIPHLDTASDLTLDYINTSGNVLLTFDKPLLVDLSLNDFTDVDNELTLLALEKLSSTEYNINVGVSGEPFAATKSFSCNYYNVLSSEINVSVDTIPPELTSISLSSKRLFSDAAYSTITVNFSKPLSEDDAFSLEDNFSYTLSSGSNYTIDFSSLETNDGQTWTAYMTTSDMTVSRSFNNEVSVTYNGTTRTRSFEVHTAMLANSNICFPAGELVFTDNGYKPIELIKEGIDTIYGKQIQHVTTTVTEDETITLMRQNSIMQGMPNKDTLISNNHKVLYKGKMVRAGELQIDGVYPVKYSGEPLYNILLADGEGKMVVNGMVVETLSPENNIARLYDTLKHTKHKNVFMKLYNETYPKKIAVTK